MANPEAGRTHHLVLANGSLNVGLIGVSGMRSFNREPLSAFTMKTRSGQSKMSDLEPPFSSSGWDTWVGGRGQELQEDADQYYDSQNINTMLPGRLILAPQVYAANDDMCWYFGDTIVGNVSTLGDTGKQVGMRFPCPRNVTIVSATVYLRKTASPTGLYELRIYNESADYPGVTLLATSTNTINAASLTVDFAPYTFTFAGYAATGGTAYWFVLVENGAVTPGVSVGGYGWTEYGNVEWRLTDGAPGSWSAYKNTGLLKVNGATSVLTGDVVSMARFGGDVYAATANVYGTLPTTLYKMPETGHSFLTIPSGSSGCEAPATCLLTTNDELIYVAQGTGVVMRKYDGLTFSADGSNAAELLTTWNNHVWRSLGDSALTKSYKVSKADIVPFGTPLTFDADIVIGDASAGITGMKVYDHKLYIAKEDATLWVIGDIDDTEASQVYSLQTQTELDNGWGMETWKVFLFIPNLYGLRRFTATSMDEVGPNRNAGMPMNRTGHIRCLAGGVNWMLAAYDGFMTNYSSVLGYNELGWCELHRASAAGSRIRSLFYVGGSEGHVYFGQGTNLKVMHLPDTTNNPLAYADSKFATEGHIITSWDDAGVPMVPKIYHTATMFTNAGGSGAAAAYDTYARVLCSYQLDAATDDSAWTELDYAHTVGKSEMVFPDNVTGYRIRFKWTLSNYALYEQITPIIERVACEYVERPIPNYLWNITARLEDNITLLDGGDNRDEKTAEQILAILDTWARQPQGVTLYLPPATYGGTPPAGKLVAVQPVRVNYTSPDHMRQQRVMTFSVVEL